MKELNKYIDHTLLKPDAKPEDIEKLCREAMDYNFYAVCVNSCWVKTAKSVLSGSDVKIASVVGFPLGAMETSAKVYETETACSHGASEIDMVINIGNVKSANCDAVKHDISCVADKAHEHNAILKVILEIGLLTDEEIKKACEISENAGADFVKTSTGFGYGGATIEAVSLMRKSVSENVSVKASGGIRDYETAMAMIEAGADRIGTSSGPAIVEDK